MEDANHPPWPARPRLTGRLELSAALILTIVWVGFLIVGYWLSAYPAGVQVTESLYEPPGAIVGGKTLYLGTSHRGSDFLSDIVSATWFSTWICSLSAFLSLAIAWPLAKVASISSVIVGFCSRLTLRIICGMTIFPLFMILVVSGNFYEIRPLSLIALLVIYCLPFWVRFFVTVAERHEEGSLWMWSLFNYWLRRWASLHMLFAVLALFWWLRAHWPGSLIDIARMNATLITFGVMTAALPMICYCLISITLRLWVSIFEDQLGLFIDPYADSWIFLPTILENELDERRVRKEYEGL